jgi:uncharacterized membrane protein YedE/YeeE
MVGAIAVHAVLLRVILRRAKPVLAPAFGLPARRDIDARLVIGAALFGVGWGLAGLCPGPALTALASGRLKAVVFVLAMLAGMRLAGPLADALARLARSTSRPTVAASAARRPSGDGERAGPIADVGPRATRPPR